MKLPKRIHPLWWVLAVFIVLLLIVGCTNGVTAPVTECVPVQVPPHSGADTLHISFCAEVTP